MSSLGSDIPAVDRYQHHCAPSGSLVFPSTSLLFSTWGQLFSGEVGERQDTSFHVFYNHHSSEFLLWVVIWCKMCFSVHKIHHK